MTTSRPEHIDIHGLRHRYGCSAVRVTSRPAAIKGRTIWECADCRAFTVTFDVDDTATTTTTTTRGTT